MLREDYVEDKSIFELKKHCFGTHETIGVQKVHAITKEF